MGTFLMWAVVGTLLVLAGGAASGSGRRRDRRPYRERLEEWKRGRQ